MRSTTPKRLSQSAAKTRRIKIPLLGLSTLVLAAIPTYFTYFHKADRLVATVNHIDLRNQDGSVGITFRNTGNRDATILQISMILYAPKGTEFTHGPSATATTTTHRENSIPLPPGGELLYGSDDGIYYYRISLFKKNQLTIGAKTTVEKIFSIPQRTVDDILALFEEKTILNVELEFCLTDTDGVRSEVWRNIGKLSKSKNCCQLECARPFPLSTRLLPSFATKDSLHRTSVEIRMDSSNNIVTDIIAE